MTACPYCHRDEMGEPVMMDTQAPPPEDFSREMDLALGQLASEDLYVRDQAAARLEKLGISATTTLIQALEEHKKPALGIIAKILGRVGDKRAIGPLSQSARSGDEALRLMSVWALAQFRDSEALPALLMEAERPHPVIQSYLASVLGNFQDLRAVPVLSRLTQHSSREVAFHAVAALGELRTPESTRALQRAYRRRDPMIRAMACAALSRRGISPLVASGLLWKMIVGAMVLGLLMFVLVRYYK